MKRIVLVFAIISLLPALVIAQRKPKEITRESVLNDLNSKSVDKEKIDKEGLYPNAFAKKFRTGIALNMYWSSVVGNNLPEQYFWKPSLGGIIHARYNFKEWVGLSAGVGFQQSGGGIINDDISGGAFSHPWIVNKFGVRGDPDSTYLEKLRFNNIDVPILLELRTRRDVLQEGWRLSGSIGVDVMRTVKVNQIFQSVIDGFHDDHYVTEKYIKTDLGLMAALGFDVDPGSGQMFQCQFVWMKGTKNIYKVDPGDGRNSYMGIKFVWYW
ncbi:MAG TPA: outer membrane beta-barrel protein [Cyclobacteriaceae bacterium]|nr:outer membrane beta-barrel protein [Cyclobacteriaceae bacterium]